jgi:hypothetical protein
MADGLAAGLNESRLVIRNWLPKELNALFNDT